MKRPLGFTLIEMLVVLAILGIVLTALLHLQTGTIRVSSQEMNTAERLVTLTDVSGYIGDTVKAAQQLPDGWTISLDGASFVCTRAPTSTGSLPCLAAVLPIVSDDATTGELGKITGWELVAYRYMARSDMSSTHKDSDHLDAHAHALQEVRVTSSCGATVASNSTCFSGAATSAWIVDDLSLPAGTSVFAYDAISRVVTLRLRSVSLSGSTVRYTPTTDMYEVKVYARNAS